MSENTESRQEDKHSKLTTLATSGSHDNNEPLRGLNVGPTTAVIVDPQQTVYPNIDKGPSSIPSTGMIPNSPSTHDKRSTLSSSIHMPFTFTAQNLGSNVSRNSRRRRNSHYVRQTRSQATVDSSEGNNGSK